jgi:uroporphyrinogen-III synthase
MARVLITRAEPEASATADLVAAIGHDPLVLPLTQTEVLPEGLEDVQDLGESRAGLFVLTSARAIQVLADAGLSAWAAKQRWAVVGERAATLLADLGADLIAPPAVNVAALIDLLSDRSEPMIYLAAFDRKPAPEARFARMQVIPVYRAKALGGFDPAAISSLRTTPPDDALVYSARGAALLTEAISKAGLSEPLRATRWLCLSPDVAAHCPETVKGTDRVEVAEQPTQTALLALLPAGG